MTFRDESAAARARIEALERRLAEAEAEAARLRATGPARAGIAGGIARRPAAWLGLAALQVGAAALIALDGGRPPWDELFPVLGVGTIASLVLAAVSVRRVAGPQELLVVCGRRHVAPDGSTVGFRLVRPGEAVVPLPLVERVDRMDLGALPFELAVEGAIARDGAARLEASAVVGVGRSSPRIERAVERFLGRPPSEMVGLARGVLEGAVRAVVAQVPREMLEREREEIALRARQIADQELEALGLEILSFTLGRIGP